MSIGKLVRLFLLLPLLAAGCAAPAPDPRTPSRPGPTPAPTVTPIPPPLPTLTTIPEPPTLPLDLSDVGVITPTLPIKAVTVFGYTYQKPNGNRLALGAGQMTTALPIDIKLDGAPDWVVGVPVDGGGTIWTAVMASGSTQSFLVLAGAVTPIHVQPAQLPAGMPPLIMIHRGAPRHVTVPGEDASPLTHPVVIGNDPARFAYIARNGDLVVNLAGEATRFEVEALPDARILQDGQGRLLVLTGATDRYAHGVLGDRIEAGSITLFATDPPRILQVIDTGAQVVEGTAPIWADLDDNGDWEILVTLSDDAEGARLVIFDEAGNRLSEGPSAGRGFRWRHQLVAAPFEGGPNLIIADNLTPHIGGITEFFRWDLLDGLTVFSSVAGYSTHRLGSRNLDQALAGDLDGDGQIELLLPAEGSSLVAAFRAAGGFASAAWTLELGSRPSSNFASVTMLDGSMAIGIGLESGILRLWLP